MHRLIQYYIHKSRELHAWRVLVVWTEWHRQGRRGIADRTKEPAEIYHQRHRGHGRALSPSLSLELAWKSGDIWSAMGNNGMHLLVLVATKICSTQPTSINKRQRGSIAPKHNAIRSHPRTATPHSDAAALYMRKRKWILGSSFDKRILLLRARMSNELEHYCV